MQIVECSYDKHAPEILAIFNDAIQTSTALYWSNVHKDHRGKGAGCILLNRLVERATEQDYHVMIAGIDVTNAASIALHKSWDSRRLACSTRSNVFAMWNSCF